uniref:WD40 repeat-like protein n=1 Tax=Psilocybe cubensis TaxID=181762 RepID=A0A8H7Y6B8_PSICU
MSFFDSIMFGPPTSAHIKYEPTSNSLKDVYSHPKAISNLVVKDKDIVIFSSEDKIHILECEPKPYIVQTFDSHKESITSLSLSNDNTLLSSTSEGALHVYNLTLGSHTIMRGLPSQDITTALFHPHTRNKLLVASGKQLMVYETTRPSGPVKTIVTNESTSGDITCVACSPFSKTLVAIATPAGFVGLIDLEKEKALFRTLNLKTPITALGFSPEGAAIYLGTSTGKLQILDLRSLDKPTKSIILSNVGSRIETISVQKKAKTAEASVKTPAGMTSRKASEVQTVPRRATSTQSSKPGSKTVSSPARARPGATSTLKEGGSVTTPKRPTASKVLSPIRDPLGNSASGAGGTIASQLDDLSAHRRDKTVTTPRRPSSKSSPTKARSGIGERKLSMKSDITENPRRARTLPSSTSTSALTHRKPSSSSITASASASDRLGTYPTAGRSPTQRARAISSASRAPDPSDTISGISPKSATATSTTTGTITTSSRPSSASSLTSRFTREGTGSPTKSSKPNAYLRSEPSRTPSPDLPDIHLEPVTPVPAHKQKKKNLGVLGLGTPEVDRWIQAGKVEKRGNTRDTRGKGKVVGFQDEEEEDVEKPNGLNEDDAMIKERERTLSMQISPRRPLPGGSGGGSNAADSWSASTSVPNPLNAAGTGASGSGSSAAQELLKTIVQDVMYDFRQETKAEMMGLHLDLLRMGRGWKNELRMLMDEYVGDLRELREENQRLRLENERLRRGY